MRKIKLMALLLATLMVVAAFAGCAGVKEDEFDALDVRVQALEDLLNGQQAALEEIKNSVAGGNDYTEILDAIESVKTDLEDKIKDVNDRVDSEIGKVGPTASVSDETKAAQQKALALIEVRRAEYSKNSDEYTTEEYTKISEALGTATGAVNAATTVEAVNAAMAALDAELGKYMTYAMKAYDYYVQLLGNINADAEDLVAEAKAFLKEVAKVYEGKAEFTGKLDGASATGTKEAVVVELAYLVSEGSTEKSDDYIDTYTAIKELCDLYTKDSATASIPYVASNGKVKLSATIKSLAWYTEEAEDLVEEIEEKLGEKFIYGTAEYNSVAGLADRYEAYVDQATFLGGQKLVDLVTNAADIVAAEDTYNLLAEAAAEFDKATRVKAGEYKDVFYYYTALSNKKALEIGDVWVADEYEKVDDILASWIAEFELSEDNVNAIIEKKMGDKDFYNTYKLDKHTNDLYVAAVNEFKSEIAPKILDLNEADAPSVDLVLAYDEIEELFEDFLVLQEKSTEKDAEYQYTKDIRIDDLDNLKVIIREADLFDEFEDERLDLVFTNNTTISKFLAANGLIDLYTFEADVDEIESREDDDDRGNVYFDLDDDNRATGEIYDFLVVKYTGIKNIANGINDRIEALVEKVEDNAIYTNEDFVKLEGVYKALDSETFKSGDREFKKADNVYVAVADLYKKDAFETYMKGLLEDADKSNDTIEAFNTVYADFAEMIDVDEFKAAKATMDARMESLFDLAEQFVEEYNAIEFVRDGAIFYEDDNNNGKYDFEYVDADQDGEYDEGEEITYQDTIVTGQTVKYAVSLNDKADVDVALATFNKWAEQGGNLNQEIFTNFVGDTDDDKDEVYADVFFMYGFQDAQRTEVKDASEGIHALRADIVALEEVVADFVAIVNNVKAVDAVTKFNVNIDTNSLDGKTYISRLAYTKFTKSTKDGATQWEGTYTYVRSDDATDTDSSAVKEAASDTAAYNALKSSVMTKKALLAAAVAAYDAFVDTHIEYVAASNNDYDNGVAYYTVTEYVPYAAFDAAAKDYASFDLYNVKCAILNTVTGSSVEIANFRNVVLNAKSVSAIENYISMYKSMGAITIADNFVAVNSIAK